MSQPTSHEPSLLETMQLVINASLEDVHTAMPATIQSFDPSTQTASVRLGIPRKYPLDLKATEYPILTQVPVVMPSVAGGYLRLPVAAGDTGMVVFSERCIDNWLLFGGAREANGIQRFALSEAVFMLGLVPSDNIIVPLGDPTSIELACGGTRVELTALGKVRITNGVADLLGSLDATLTALIAAPSLATSAAALTATRLLLRTLMP